jgi:nitrile hydratase subunit beta
VTYASHADLGGQLGHGRVVPEPEREIFHAQWEAEVLALTLAAGGTGQWNLDESRAARETVPRYADLSYYEIWYEGLVRLLLDRDLVGADEVAAGHMLRPATPVPRVLHAADVPAALARGGPTVREVDRPAAFAVGQRARMRAGTVEHHTRLPGYVAGHVGRVERIHGAHVFPDTHAHGLGERPQWLYTVEFDAADLWPDASPGATVCVDAWEPYMEPA